MKPFILITLLGIFVTVSSNYIALKGSVVINKAEINDLGSGISQTQLSCARKCKNDGNCEGVLYNNTDGRCGLVERNGFNKTIQGLTGTAFQVESRIEKKLGQWRKVLSVNRSGGILSGSFEDLKAALLCGGKLQIVMERQDNLTFSFAINSAFIRENVVCGQSEIYISNSNKWVSFLVCTNGRSQWLRVRINVTESEEISEHSYDYYNKTNWFIFEDACPQVMLRENSKPFITNNNVHEFSVTVAETLDEFIKVNHKTHVVIFHADENVEVISLLEICLTVAGQDFDFAENSSWITTKLNFSKHIEEFRCTISDNKPCIHSEKAVNQILYIDGNWKKIFSHTSEGYAVFGSLQNLREKVLNGQRLLIHFSDKMREPDIVILDENNITIIFSTYPLKQPDSNQAKVIWEMISTSGKYEGVEFDFMTGSVLNITTGTRECSWLIDKATWTNVFDSKSITTEKLITAIASGSGIRIKSHCLDINENSTLFTCLYGATNIYLDQTTSKIIARGNLYPCPTITDTGLNFSIDANPIWMSLQTYTQGKVTRKLWIHGSPAFESNPEKINHEITWFAN